MAQVQMESVPKTMAEVPEEARPPRLDVMLQTRGLTRRYGQTLVVNNLNLEVVRGDIYGLLGPEGAGKTTTLRMLLNLLKPAAGEIWLFGERLSFMPGRLMPRVGALFEQPSFQPYLSGRDNLIALGGYTGGVPVRRVDEVLEMVGLRARRRERYAGYSPGMRQQLGMAAALLTDPELLILDEPCGGLDAARMAELRGLLRRLAAAGKTILLTSHVPEEVRRICTRVGVMRGGQLLASGTVEDMLVSGASWEIEVAHPETVGLMFRQMPGARSASIENGMLVLEAPERRGSEIIRYLGENGVWPESVRRSEETMEQVLLRLTEQGVGR